MKPLHAVKITVFVKPEEYNSNNSLIDTIKEHMQKLIPIDFEKEEVFITEEKLEGFENRVIKKLTLEVTKESHTKAFLKELLSHLNSEQKKLLNEQAESRIDEDCNFFVRLEGTQLLKGIYEITDSGNCFHIKLTIAAFPKKKPAALNVVKEIF